MMENSEFFSREEMQEHAKQQAEVDKLIIGGLTDDALRRLQIMASIVADMPPDKKLALAQDLLTRIAKDEMMLTENLSSLAGCCAALNGLDFTEKLIKTYDVKSEGEKDATL